jgi:tryptophan 2,3-dioxygenase
MPTPPAVTYWDYLRLPELLALQGGLEGNDVEISEDELHFIVVHQVFELWFKLMLRELRLARDKMAAPWVEEETVPYVVHHLRRINEILRLAAEQFRVMETLTPQDFLAFRSKLGTASGFQSFQMRQIEAILGLQPEQRAMQGHTDPLHSLQAAVKHARSGTPLLARVLETRQETSLREALHAWLSRTPIQGSYPTDPDDPRVVEGFLQAYLEALQQHQNAQMAHLLADGSNPAAVRAQFAAMLDSARTFLTAADVPEAADRSRTCRIRAGLLFIESYRDLPLLAWPRLLIDTVVEMEELFVLWRTRHARMVERVIGRRVGTGGSSGVDYLDETARYRIFPELWAVRTLLLPRAVLPPLQKPEVYSFAVEQQPLAAGHDSSPGQPTTRRGRRRQ